MSPLRNLGGRDASAAPPGDEGVAQGGAEAPGRASLRAPEGAQQARLTALVEATKAITSNLSLEDVLQSIVREASNITGIPVVRLFLIDEGSRSLRWRVGIGLPPEEERDTVIRVGESFSGAVAATGRPLAVADCREDARLRFARHSTVYGLISYLGLPIRSRDRLFGVLVFNTTAPRTYSEEEIAYLSAFADQAAIAIENARLYESVQHEAVERRQAEAALAEQTRRLEAVRTVATEITRALDLTALLQLIIRRATDLVGAAGGMVCLWNEATQRLSVRAWHGVAPWLTHQSIQLGEGVAGMAAQRREGLIVNNFRTSPYATPLQLERTSHTAVLAEPLMYRDRLVGVILLTSEEPGRPFTTGDREILRPFATQAAIAIENARLYADLRHAYEKTQRAQEELIRSEQLRALGQMAAGIAHGLNNVLASILGQVELLRIQVREPAVQERLGILETAATDGVHVVRRLQGFARRQPSGPLISCDLALLVQEVVELTRPRWEIDPRRREVVIEARTALGPLPLILGHPAEIREALTNLIFNAVDAMPEGGLLTLAGHATSEGVTLAVSDTGVGMAEEVRQHIFEPFFTTKGDRGSGLGLSLVYAIMERHGGHIEVTSAPGEGTTFTLQFQTSPQKSAST